MPDAIKAVADAAAAEKDKAVADKVDAGVAAATAGVAAATAGAVLATTAAARAAEDAEETAEELEEEQAWLRQQVQAQGKALSTLAENQNRQASQTAAVLAGLEKLTASISKAPAEPEPVNPAIVVVEDPALEPGASEVPTQKPRKQAKEKDQPPAQRYWM